MIFRHPPNPMGSSPDSGVYELEPGHEPVTVRLWTTRDFTDSGVVNRCQIEFGHHHDRAGVSVTMGQGSTTRVVRIDRYHPQHLEWLPLAPDHPETPSIITCAVALVERYFANLPIFGGRSSPIAFFRSLNAA